MQNSNSRKILTAPRPTTNPEDLHQKYLWPQRFFGGRSVFQRRNNSLSLRTVGEKDKEYKGFHFFTLFNVSEKNGLHLLKLLGFRTALRRTASEPKIGSSRDLPVENGTVRVSSFVFGFQEFFRQINAGWKTHRELASTHRHVDQRCAVSSPESQGFSSSWNSGRFLGAKPTKQKSSNLPKRNGDSPVPLPSILDLPKCNTPGLGFPAR